MIMIQVTHTCHNMQTTEVDDTNKSRLILLEHLSDLCRYIAIRELSGNTYLFWGFFFFKYHSNYWTFFSPLDSFTCKQVEEHLNL